MKLTNVSNPAAFGVEWINPESGSMMTLFTTRGMSTLHFGMKRDGTDVWSTTPVVNPDRFGFTGPVKSSAEFMKIARAFVDAGTESE